MIVMSALLAVENDGSVGWATGVMEALGGPGVGIAIALENLFPPIPSEVILPLAGFTAGQGKMSVLAAILWATAGSTAGAVVLYYLGALLGRARTRAIAGRVPLIKISDMDRTEAWFARHGAKAVFFGRMVPVFRSFISLPAGIERMRMSTFLVLTVLGSLIWNAAFVSAGFLLGENWWVVEEYAGAVSKAVLVAVALVVVGFLATRVIRALRGSRTDEAEEGEAHQTRR